MIDVNCDAGGRHEFGVSYSLDLDEVGFFVACKKCDEVILDGQKEIIPKLNAALMFSARDAARLEIELADTVGAVDEPKATVLSGWAGWMREYARRWRGDTEESE